jgi:hypothetical protein
MQTEVTCRGCGIRVTRAAHLCYACKCPFPTCHLPEMPERSVRVTHWRWTAPVAVGLLLTGIVVGGICYVASQWQHFNTHSLPNMKANISTGTR